MQTYLDRRLKGLARQQEQDGFTLIELLVVLLIVGILLGIAIPTYLGLTSSAKQTAAESNLQTALTNAKSVYTQEGQAFSSTFVSDMNNSGSGLTYTADASSTGDNSVDTDIPTNGASQVVVLAAEDNNVCYAIADQEAAPSTAVGNLPTTGGTYFGSFAMSSATSTTCSASNAEKLIPAGSWNQGSFN